MISAMLLISAGMLSLLSRNMELASTPNSAISAITAPLQ